MPVSHLRLLLSAAAIALPAPALLTCAESTTAQDGLPVTLFAYDRAAPLALEESGVSEDSASRLLRVSFASPGGGRATGFLAVPKAPGPHPGVVVMHGLPGSADGAMGREGRELVARSAVVIAIDAPWVRRGGLPDFTVRDSVEQVQLILDLQRAVDVLLARTDVDPKRVAYVGGSYGGAMGALFVGIERRLRASVLFVADGGLVAHFTDADGAFLGPAAGLDETTRRRWLGAMEPIEPIRFVGRANAPIFFQNGRQDQLVSVEDAEALHAAAPAGNTVRWYDAGHGLTLTARADRRAWLAERIGTMP